MMIFGSIIAYRPAAIAYYVILFEFALGNDRAKILNCW